MSKKGKKYVYFYGLSGKKNLTEGDAKMKALLGGKGANLAEMANVGVPVPPGFTISTEACADYNALGLKFPKGMWEETLANLGKLEKVLDKKLGDATNPLLVSVRSGAAASMPGMMDTVLNLGLNDKSVLGFIEKTGNARAGWDSYRRFIDMFGDVVMGPTTGLNHEHYEEAMEKIKKKYGAKQDTDLTADQLKELVDEYKKVYAAKVKSPFPQDALEQLKAAICAVFNSWNSPRAVKYRQAEKITGLIGTAVNICSMVFGNMGDTSGTGVAFTRNPATGENLFFGEYLVNAQGEDVVAGIRTPESIDNLEKKWPALYKQLDGIRLKLERHYKDMQDLEFTIQEGELFMLQTRNGKRTGFAAVQMAYDMVNEKLIKPEDALLRIQGDHLNQLMFPVFDIKKKAEAVKAKKCIAKGLPAGPGAASGQVVFSAADAEAWKKKGKKVILVRHETSPEDVGGMHVAEAVLTSTGGMTSHAAVVARGWGKCCVVGAGSIEINYKSKSFTSKGTTVKEGDWISIDGSTGEVIFDHLPTQASPVIDAIVNGNKAAQNDPIYKMFKQITDWADKYRKIGVRTNADTPKDAQAARDLGAEGIGLTRTEHMFFEGKRILSIREFILAEDEAGRRKALKKLLPLQRGDFEGIFKAMNGLPVTIRLIDPPLHEFVPHDDAGQKEMAEVMGLSLDKIKSIVESLKEFNPMLGHRGCRLSITYPELCEMQTRAIIEAACNMKKAGIDARPEIMIPLIGKVEEFNYLDAIVRQTAEEIIKEAGVKISYMVGTMIEIPRAALTADAVAEKAEFFSFGTNDLTQMTFGYSRDDAGVFLNGYIEKGILIEDPFQSLDQTGVGQLVKMGIDKGRSVRPKLKVGICGEHGGDSKSVIFCHKVGMDYVSCSPYRVPVARLAAAQAAIADARAAKAKKGKK